MAPSQRTDSPRTLWGHPRCYGFLVALGINAIEATEDILLMNGLEDGIKNQGL